MRDTTPLSYSDPAPPGCCVWDVGRAGRLEFSLPCFLSDAKVLIRPSPRPLGRPRSHATRVDAGERVRRPLSVRAPPSASPSASGLQVLNGAEDKTIHSSSGGQVIAVLDACWPLSLLPCTKDETGSRCPARGPARLSSLQRTALRHCDARNFVIAFRLPAALYDNSIPLPGAREPRAAKDAAREEVQARLHIRPGWSPRLGPPCPRLLPNSQP